MHLIELDLEGLYINSPRWISRPKAKSMFKENEHVEVIELAGSEARVQESMTSDAYGEVWLRTDKIQKLIVKQPTKEFRLQDLIDNELYYTGTVLVLMLLSFDLGLVIGLVIL
jgi:hypothetical protein